MTKQMATEAQHQVKNYLAKEYPDLSEKDMRVVLDSMRQLISVAKRVVSEPQFRVSYKKIEGKKPSQQRIVETTIEELGKLLNKQHSARPIEAIMAELKDKVVAREKAYGNKRQ